MPNFISQLLKSIFKPLFQKEIEEAQKVPSLTSDISYLTSTNSRLRERVNRFKNEMDQLQKEIDFVKKESVLTYSKTAKLVEDLKIEIESANDEANKIKSEFEAREKSLIEANRLLSEEKERFQKLATENGAEFIRLKSYVEPNLKKLENNLRLAVIQLSHHNDKHRMVSTDLLLGRFKGIFPDWFTQENKVENEKTQ